MRKKCFMGLVAACVCCFVASVFTACGTTTDFKAEFKENVKTDIQVNQCIDIEDYIVKVPNTTYKITFSYEDTVKQTDVVDELEGVTYFFKQTTDYIMEYTVTSGKKSKSAELKFSVYGLAPTLTVGVPVITYPKNTTVNLEALIENANPFYTPVDCTVEIQSVYYQRESVTLEKTIEEGTSYERSLKDEETFTFDKEGSYLFTLAASSEYGTSTETIKVEVLNKSSGNEDTLKNENGEAVIYNAEVDGNTVRMLRGAESSTVSYMVLDGEYGEDDVFRFEFKGKNCPQIGLLTKEDETSINPYGIRNGQGYVFSFEDNYTDKFSCWGPTKRAGSNLHNGNTSSGYFGRDDFEDDKYYSVEARVFTYKETETHLQVFIYRLDGYNTDNESFSLIYKARVGWKKRDGHPSSGKIIFYGSLKENICFKYYKPMTQDIDSSTFNYNQATRTLSWGAVEGALYHISLDNVNYTQQSKPSYVLNGSTYGTQAVYVKTATLRDSVSYVVLMHPEGDVDKIGVGGSVPSVRYSEDCKQITAEIDPHNKGGERFKNVNYIYTEKDYSAGSNYIRLEFTGAEFAGNILFGVTNEPSSTMDNVYGFGLCLDYNGGGYHLNNASTNSIVRAKFVSGEALTPYLNYNYLRLKDKNEDAQTEAGCVRGEGGEKNFVMIIGTSVYEEGNVKQISLDIWLYEKISDTEIKLLTERSYKRSQTTPNETGKIMITGNYITGKQTKFKMWLPDTLENAQAALNSDYTVVGE